MIRLLVTVAWRIWETLAALLAPSLRFYVSESGVKVVGLGIE